MDFRTRKQQARERRNAAILASIAKIPQGAAKVPYYEALCRQYGVKLSTLYRIMRKIKESSPKPDILQTRKPIGKA